MHHYHINGQQYVSLVESLTKGFEHGHFHHHHEEKNILPIALMFGMFIHAFLEGLIPDGKERVNKVVQTLY